MTSVEQNPPIVRWTLGLERARVLDAPVRALEPAIRSLFGTGPRGAALRGEWLGHALHPVLTDVVIGTWTSANLLDLVGGKDGAVPARRLIGIGLLAAGPTAWSGWAEWSELPTPDKRVGLVHAVANGVAIGLYARSWLARRSGRRGDGALLGLAGSAVAGVGAYLGGHLAQARQVSSHHPAYDDTVARP